VSEQARAFWVVEPGCGELRAEELALPASGEELVVATFGGTFVDNSKKCHATAFEKATGATVKYVLGSSVQTMAKLRAAGARAEFDVAYMDSQIVKQAKAARMAQPQ